MYVKVVISFIPIKNKKNYWVIKKFEQTIWSIW